VEVWADDRVLSKVKMQPRKTPRFECKDTKKNTTNVLETRRDTQQVDESVRESDVKSMGVPKMHHWSLLSHDLSLLVFM